MTTQIFGRVSRKENYQFFRDSAKLEETSTLMAYLAGIEVSRRHFGLIGKISRYLRGPQEKAIRDTLLERITYKEVYHNNTPKKTFLERRINDAADYYGWDCQE